MVVRIERGNSSTSMSRHREWIVREIDLLLFLAPPYIGKSTIAAELETILGDEAELLADFGARAASEL